MRPFLLAILISIVCWAPLALAEGKPYNVNPFSWKAVGLDDRDLRLKGEGESTRARKAWRKVLRRINLMARKGELADMTPLRVELTWRGRKIVRVVYSHATAGPWPVFPKKGKRWAYDPVRQEPRCYPPSRD